MSCTTAQIEDQMQASKLVRETGVSIAEAAVIEDDKPVVWVVDCPRCLHTFSVKPASNQGADLSPEKVRELAMQAGADGFNWSQLDAIDLDLFAQLIRAARPFARKS